MDLHGRTIWAGPGRMESALSHSQGSVSVAAAMISRNDIAAAAARTAGYVRHTPLLRVAGAEFGLDFPVTLKLELMQHAGSFKPRGAFNRLLSASLPRPV